VLTVTAVPRTATTAGQLVTSERGFVGDPWLSITSTLYRLLQHVRHWLVPELLSAAATAADSDVRVVIAFIPQLVAHLESFKNCYGDLLLGFVRDAWL
jgi:hypothetical protein